MTKSHHKSIHLKKKAEGITNEFEDTVRSAGPEEKKGMLIRLQNEQHKAEHFLKNNPEIIDLSEQLKTLKAPCKDAIKVVKNRIIFILQDLENDGQVL